MTKHATLLICLGLLSMAGCSRGPYEVAPVSGVVKLDGEPLPNATVSFEPQGNGAEVVGPGSVGTTSDNGEFMLRTFKDERGAVVGQHTVRISTFKSKFKDLKNSDAIEVVSAEHVPPKYNRNTTLSFEVPRDGTDEADFALESN